MAQWRWILYEHFTHFSSYSRAFSINMNDFSEKFTPTWWKTLSTSRRFDDFSSSPIVAGEACKWEIIQVRRRLKSLKVCYTEIRQTSQLISENIKQFFNSFLLLASRDAPRKCEIVWVALDVVAVVVARQDDTLAIPYSEDSGIRPFCQWLWEIIALKSL